LPAFARRYQGVLDPLNDSGELAKLIKASTGDWDREVVLTGEPVVGLRAMDESWANRFFGRKTEVRELVDKFKKHRLVAIVADSGAGKSSLAQAGLIPAFRRFGGREPRGAGRQDLACRHHAPGQRSGSGFGRKKRSATAPNILSWAPSLKPFRPWRSAANRPPVGRRDRQGTPCLQGA
jgi:hypothetical protein